jgi:hypothetical protein
VYRVYRILLRIYLNKQGISSNSPDSRSHGIVVNGTSTKDGSDAMDVDSNDEEVDRAVPSHPKKRISG